MGRGTQGSGRPEAGCSGNRKRAARILPLAHRPLQVPALGRLYGQPAQDWDRKNIEERAAQAILVRNRVDSSGIRDTGVKHQSLPQIGADARGLTLNPQNFTGPNQANSSLRLSLRSLLCGALASFAV